MLSVMLMAQIRSMMLFDWLNLKWLLDLVLENEWLLFWLLLKSKSRQKEREKVEVEVHEDLSEANEL